MSFLTPFAELSFSRGQRIDLPALLVPELHAIWARHPNLTPWTADGLGPLPPFYPAYAHLEQVQVLGLNPSYTPQDRQLLAYEPGFDAHPYFRRMGNFMRQVVATHGLLQDEDTGFDKQLYQFGELSWEHLDLLYMRTTSQQALEAQVWHTPGAAAFVWQQLQLTKRLLALLQPVAIVVANRFGQRLTGFYKNAQTGTDEWMGLQFTAKPDAHGAYRITGSTTNGQPDPDGAYGLADTPVFFTGSFAGTNPRNGEADNLLITNLAQTCLQEGTRYFERWHMR